MISSNKIRMLHRCWRYRFKSEVSSIRFVRNLDLKGTTMLDIGANKGVFSIYMSRAAGPNGKVFCFEAQPELGPHLQSVKEKFGLNNLDIANIGLSSSPGTMKLYRIKAGSGGASFDIEIEAQGILEELDVPVTTLDEFLGDKEVGSISFIKCDVEGHELHVFRGAEQALTKHMPILLYECHRAQEEEGALFRYLVDLGYDGFFFHTTAEDHASLHRKGRDKLVHYSEHTDYEYCRPSVTHRNYIFARKDVAQDYLSGKLAR